MNHNYFCYILIVYIKLKNTDSYEYQMNFFESKFRPANLDLGFEQKLKKFAIVHNF